MKYEHLIRLSGGLGDVLLWCLRNNKWNNIINFSKENGIVISNFSHNSSVYELLVNTPFSKNMLIYNHNINVPLGTIEERMVNMTNYENIFLKNNNISCSINRNLSIFESDNLQNMKKYLTIEDQDIIYSLLQYEKPIITISPFASSFNRSIPMSIVENICSQLGDKYTLVQIGKNNSNYRNKKEYGVQCDGVINLVDKLSISATLHLIDISFGLLTCASSMYCYGAYNKKNILIVIPTKSDPKFGFVDKKKRLHYFKYLDDPNIICCDFKEYDQNIFNNFKNLIL